jgi:hypothetical protein
LPSFAIRCWNCSFTEPAYSIPLTLARLIVTGMFPLVMTVTTSPFSVISPSKFCPSRVVTVPGLAQTGPPAAVSTNSNPTAAGRIHPRVIIDVSSTKQSHRKDTARGRQA